MQRAADMSPGKNAHEERPIRTWSGFIWLIAGIAQIGATVSNRMVVLCAQSEVQPVINTGTLYN